MSETSHSIKERLAQFFVNLSETIVTSEVGPAGQDKICFLDMKYVDQKTGPAYKNRQQIPDH